MTRVTEHAEAGSVGVEAGTEAVRVCPVCGHRPGETERRSGVLASCGSCGLLFRAFAMGADERSYWSGYVDNGAEQRYDASRRMYYRHFWNAVARLHGARPRDRAARVLDVGCVPGMALREAAADGWEIHGVEISEELCERTREFCGARMWRGFLEEIDFGADRFDVVMFSDVMRAVTRPVDALRKAGSLLAPGGVVIVREIDCSRPKHAGRIAKPYKYDQQLFTTETLLRAMRTAGFARVDAHNSPMSMMTSIRWRKLMERAPGVYRAMLSALNGGLAAADMTVCRATGPVTPSFLAAGREWSAA